MITKSAIEKILDLPDNTPVSSDLMARTVKVTFLDNFKSDNTPEMEVFRDKLRQSLERLNVEMVDAKDAFEFLSLKKVLTRLVRVFIGNTLYVVRYIFNKEQKSYFFPWSGLKYVLQRKKLKKGISAIVFGEVDASRLPIKYVHSFKHNSIVTVLPLPDNLTGAEDFKVHFDTSMRLFAYHATNLVILVGKETAMLYNFNASHPTFSLQEDITPHILEAVLPKIAAPILPCKMEEFSPVEFPFDENRGEAYLQCVNDLVEGSKKFNTTGLYPEGKKIDSLPFRSSFIRWVGKLHLDNRNGMSFGFLARQLPVGPSKLEKVIECSDASLKSACLANKSLGWFFYREDLYVVFNIKDDLLYMKVPEVWVLTQRSGCNKTNMDPEKDVFEMGLKNGRMMFRYPKNKKAVNITYKPSFDTKVILAHAVGNAILSSVFKHIGIQADFVKKLKDAGYAIAHWHGYFHPELLPNGVVQYGFKNPHVACSSPQSAIYALDGKLRHVIQEVSNLGEAYCGDVHVEPHHGTNINYPSLDDLYKYFFHNPKASVLGNTYLNLYN